MLNQLRHDVTSETVDSTSYMRGGENGLLKEDANATRCGYGKSKSRDDFGQENHNDSDSKMAIRFATADFAG